MTKHLKLKKWRPLTSSWLKGSLKASPESGDPVVTSSIYGLDLLSKCTLCPNPPGSPLLMLILPCKPWLIFHTQPVCNTRKFRMHDDKRTWQTPLRLCTCKRRVAGGHGTAWWLTKIRYEIIHLTALQETCKLTKVRDEIIYSDT